MTGPRARLDRIARAVSSSRTAADADRAEERAEVAGDAAPAKPEGSPAAIDEVLIRLLAEGGDDRLLLDGRGVNKYHTPAAPTLGGIHRSSCTSSSCTDHSFQLGRELVARLLEEGIGSGDAEPGQLYVDLLEDVRSRIFKVWKLEKEDVAVTLCPSGSDAEYLPVLIAILRVLCAFPEGNWGSGILTIVTGAGEVGSGTLNAARGRHFSNVSPKGSAFPIQNGGNVFTFPQGFPQVDAKEVTLRNQGASLKSTEEMDNEVFELVETALTESDYRVVVVHMVTGSKTGYLVPSLNVLEELVRKHGKRIVPVVDACQGRLADGALQNFLNDQFAILITGSKFYGGPPFSGAVLLPQVLAREIDEKISWVQTHKVVGNVGNFGLQDLHLYMDANLISEDLPHMKKSLQSNNISPNYGLLLRWSLALNEVELYHQIPERYRNFIMGHWIKSVQKTIREADPEQKLIDCVENERGSDFATTAEGKAGMFWCNTIVSLICRVPSPDAQNLASEKATRRLTTNELKKLHLIMSLDLAGILAPADYAHLESHMQAFDSEVTGACGIRAIGRPDDILLTKCFIAQPVALQPSVKQSLTVIRVAIGAPLVHLIFESAQMLSPTLDMQSRIERVINEKVSLIDRVLFLKMYTILQNWETFEDYEPQRS